MVQPVNSSSLAHPMGTQTTNGKAPEAKKRKRDKNPTPEQQFTLSLAACSQSNDLPAALALYEEAVASEKIHITSYHFNILLHICSNAGAGDIDPRKQPSVEAAFRIFDHMVSSGNRPTEATITSMARIAASDVSGGGGDKAFELVKDMKSRYELSPKLRTYGPALFAFCRRSEDADKAYAVEEHMVAMGVPPEEQELAALLKVSSEAGRGDKVYEYMQKLSCVGCVDPSTAENIERWFRNGFAEEVGRVNWDEGRVKDAIFRNGGGWHGEGWLGKGKWNVCRSKVELNGSCHCCGERLASVDIGQVETEKFGESVASLAMEREVVSNFKFFQNWLNDHADFEAIVDGANVGFYQQNFADGGFSLSQLENVVKELCEKSEGKLPLVVIHNRRLLSLIEDPSNRQLLEDWQAQGVLYATPNGSNDDWYWLYAAVKLKCLLVTNDEMRDHIFELLGSNFFPKWKERHQVRYTFLKGELKLEMPHPYSTVIQESEKGSWHVPLDEKCEDERLRTWLCITRYQLGKTANEVYTVQFSTNLHRIDDDSATSLGKRRDM